jgi:hypothetical protein
MTVGVISRTAGLLAVPHLTALSRQHNHISSRRKCLRAPETSSKRCGRCPYGPLARHHVATPPSAVPTQQVSCASLSCVMLGVVKCALLHTELASGGGLRPRPNSDVTPLSQVTARTIVNREEAMSYGTLANVCVSNTAIGRRHQQLWTCASWCRAPSHLNLNLEDALISFPGVHVAWTVLSTSRCKL